jgi:hypothetical protein
LSSGVSDKWLIIDEPLPRLTGLIIEGGLSAETDASLDLTIEADYIIVSGRLVIGWPNEPFPGTAKILLHGDYSTLSYQVGSGPELGAKFLGE